MNPTGKDIDTLARTIFGEARGEGFQGMVAVANVIMNRVNLDLGNDGKPDWWGEGIEAVCLKPYQFSCWNPNDPNRTKLLGVGANDKAFADALHIATVAAHGALVDLTRGSTHYHEQSIMPKWAINKLQRAKVGRHVFYLVY